MTAPLTNQVAKHREYIDAALFNVADAIHNVLLPQITGDAQSRGRECISILARLAQEIASQRVSGVSTAISPDATEWLALVTTDLRLLDQAEVAVDSFVARLSGHPMTGARAFNRERFQLFLRSHVLGGSATTVTECIPLAGGRSKLTTLVSLAEARALPSQVVVRQDWATSVTGTSVVSEFALLERVWMNGLKVPQPLLIETSSEVLGAPFMVVTRLPGRGRGDIFHPPASRPIALQLAEEIAKLHRLPVADFERLHVPTAAYDPAQLEMGLRQFRALIAKLSDPPPSIAIALAWLEANCHRVSGAKALVHNDLGCHNFLLGEDELIAILDWEIAHLGNPAADLGYIRGWVEKMIPWNEFLQVYHSAGGPSTSVITLNFFTLWSGVRLYCLLLQARAGIASGAVRDTEITYACAHFIPQLMKRITTQLKAIISETRNESGGA